MSVGCAGTREKRLRCKEQMLGLKSGLNLNARAKCINAMYNTCAQSNTEGSNTIDRWEVPKGRTRSGLGKHSEMKANSRMCGVTY